MLDPQSHWEIAAAQHAERLDCAQRRRMIGQLQPHLAFGQRAARVIGHALLGLSTRLLRYGGAERQAILCLDQPSQQRTSWN